MRCREGCREPEEEWGSAHLKPQRGTVDSQVPPWSAILFIITTEPHSCCIVDALRFEGRGRGRGGKGGDESGRGGRVGIGEGEVGVGMEEGDGMEGRDGEKGGEGVGERRPLLH